MYLVKVCAFVMQSYDFFYKLAIACSICRIANYAKYFIATKKKRIFASNLLVTIGYESLR